MKPVDGAVFAGGGTKRNPKRLAEHGMLPDKAYAAVFIKSRRTIPRKIEETVRDNQIAWAVFFRDSSGARPGKNPFHPQQLCRINIGTIIYVRGCLFVPPLAMTGQEQVPKTVFVKIVDGIRKAIRSANPPGRETISQDPWRKSISPGSSQQEDPGLIAGKKAVQNGIRAPKSTLQPLKSILKPSILDSTH